MFDLLRLQCSRFHSGLSIAYSSGINGERRPFVVLFSLQSFLSLQSGSNARSEKHFYLAIKSYSPMDDMLRIRRQAKTNCEAATIVNVWCSLYDKIDVWLTVKRLGLELDCMSNYIYVTEEAISCNTINGSTYDLKTQQESLKKLSRFSLVAWSRKISAGETH